MDGDLFIRNGRLKDGAPVDVLIRRGLFEAIGPALVPPAGIAVEDAAGGLVLPGLVEAHTHLDKSLLGMGWRKNDVGPRLIDKIENERKMKVAWDIDPQRQAARQIVLSVAQGSTHVLSHVDVDTDHGLSGIEGVMAARDAYRDIADIQLVAFPQSGLMRRPGTYDLMDAALALGVEWVGGLDPYGMDRDPKGHLDAIFGLAQKHGRPIDIHLHEAGEMGLQTLDLVFERVRALGMHGEVTISHAFCMAFPDREVIDPVIETLADLDIAIMTIGSPRLPCPPVKRLLDRGVRVSSGSDGIRDTWKPYGNADMLERAMFIGERCNFCRDEDIERAFAICTSGGAAVLGLADYGVAIGRRGDLVIVEADNICAAVVDHPQRKLVVKNGRVVARDGACIRTAP